MNNRILVNRAARKLLLSNNISSITRPEVAKVRSESESEKLNPKSNLIPHFLKDENRRDFDPCALGRD